MASIIKVDTIQDQDGNNIINEAANTITIGASGDTITIPSGATLANSGIVTGFQSTGIDDNATSTAITIDSSQNVGIGTSSPNTNLHISSGVSTSLQLERTASGTEGKLLLASATSFNAIFSRDGSDSDKDFAIYTGSNERMRITSSGNVGIGTSSPDYKLQVNGDIVPEANNTYDLGKSSLVWANIYTGDLHLSNEAKEQGNDIDGTKGNWTIQEGETDLYIINNKNGKKFKFKLEEIS